MNRLIDTHSHIFLEEFKDDLDDVVTRAVNTGIDTFVMPNINLASVPEMLAVRNRYPYSCYASIGLHPTDLTDNFRSELQQLKSMLDRDRSDATGLFRGIGEVGLDLYWQQDNLLLQAEAFERQIEWALEYDLPLMIHARNAFVQLCGILDKYAGYGLRGVFHCFSDGPEQAARLMEYKGFMFGIGGVVTYRKSLVPDALALIPHDRIVVETDCPYLSPVPCRGHRNEPSFMAYTVARIADVWGCDASEVARESTANACNLFGIQ